MHITDSYKGTMGANLWTLRYLYNLSSLVRLKLVQRQAEYVINE